MKRALVLTFALILALGTAAFAQGTIEGSWCTNVTINPQSPAFTGFDSTLIVDYTVGGWVFNSESVFEMTGWTGQTFNVHGTLGAFTINSVLVFDPALATFTSWTTDGSVNIGGVTFSGLWVLTTGMGFQLGVEGDSGVLSAAATIYFNLDADGNVIRDDFCICWDGLIIVLHFPFCCDLDVAMEVSFSTAGFDYVSFAVAGLVVPGIDWLTLDAKVKFAPGEGVGKLVTVDPVINFPGGCFTLYAHVDHEGGTGIGDDLVITGISIDGFKLICTIGNVSFADYTSLSWDLNSKITGDANYWEKICITSAADSCCGGAFSFNVCLWFSDDSVQLFDLGKTTISLSYGIGSNFTVTSSLVVLSTGVTEWGVGFCVIF
jgi:hypothetical protein